MNSLWHIAPRAAPAIREWGGEYVVHHALSNDTHRLSAAAGGLLQQLARAGDAGISEEGQHYTPAGEEVLAMLEALAELGFVAQC